MQFLVVLSPREQWKLPSRIVLDVGGVTGNVCPEQSVS